MVVPLNFMGIDALDFANINLWKYAAGAILFFIIIYLVRPKPNEKIIPSLMFLIRRRKKGKFNSFLQKILRDPLFLIQLFTLLLLAFAALGPFLTYQYDVSSENTVLVLDVSASMQADSHLSQMKKEAKRDAKGLVSAILIKRFPEVYFNEETESQAKRFIDALDESVSTSNILDAIKKADELLGNKTGKIVVISDFIDTQNNLEDLIQYKSFLEGKGRFIEFKVIEPVEDNIGIIKSEYLNNRITLSIKNYNNYAVTTKIGNGNDGKEINIGPNSIEVVKMTLDKGLTEIKIDRKDDFMLDNMFFINIPTSKNMKVLLYTNNEDTYLNDFLESSPYINLDIAFPPRSPKIEHDVVIINAVDKEKMISKVRDDITEYVSGGGALIINSQDDIGELGLEGLLPVKILEGTEEKGEGKIELVQDVTQDLSFPTLFNFPRVEKKDKSVVLVSANGFPVITYAQHGKGKVMYYGIPEKDNDFKVSASYPLFWSRALRFISRFNEFDDLNRKSDELDYDENIGFLEGTTKTTAINLLNEKESTVTGQSGFESFMTEILSSDNNNFVEKKFDLLLVLIPLIVLMIIIEVFFIKFRGDI